MAEYITLNHPALGKVQLRRDLAETLSPEELNQLLVKEAAKDLEANDVDIDSFSRQFAKEITSTGRGLYEMATGERTTTAKSDFLAEVAIEKDPWKAYTGMGVGALLDPVTLPAAFLKVLKLGRIGAATLAGAFGGGAGAVREEYGEDRLTNAAFGAGAGAVLGAGVEVLMRRFGVDSVEALQKLADEGGEAVQRKMERILTEESEALARMGERGRAADAQAADIAAIRSVADDPEVKAIREQMDAEAGAKAADIERIRQVGKDADIENIGRVADEFQAAREADVLRQIDEMRAEVRNLPDSPQRAGIKKDVTKAQGEIKSLTKQMSKVSKEINDIKKNKKINPQETRALVQPKQQELKRLQQMIIRAKQDEATATPFANRVKELQRAENEIKVFDKTGRIPSFVKVNEPTVPSNAPTPELQLPSQLGATSNVPMAQRVADMQAQVPAEAPVVPTRSPQEQQAIAQARIDRNLAQAQQRPSQAVQEPVAVDTVTPSVPTTQAVTPSTEAVPQRNAIVRGIDTALGALTARIERIAPEVMSALRNFERVVLEKQAKFINPTKPFFDNINKLSPDMRKTMKGHLFNGRFEEAKAMMNSDMRKQFEAIRRDLYAIHKDLKNAGIDVAYIDNYFPRRVKDVKKLREKLGREHRDAFTRAIDEATAKNDNKPLSAEQEEEVINKVVRNVYRSKDPARRSATGKRTVTEIPDDVLEFYHDPSMSLTTYYRNMIDMAEKARFFGRNTEVTDENTINLDKSIGKTIQDLRIQKNLNPNDAEDLVNMLSSRFIGGEQAPSWAFRAARDTGYAGTIGNFVSALTNLGDLGTSGALHGFTETIAALFGKNKYDVVKMGIDHTISHELQDSRLTAKALQKVFELSQFQRIDRMGKNTLINAAMRKNEKLAKTDAGKAKLRAQWGKYFGDETEGLINDLEKGNISENTKLLAFHELSNVQPITLSEMPQYYLDHPDGRIMYMLKSFTLKQLDLVRRNVYAEAKKGNYFQASKNMAVLAGFLAASNTGTQVVKDWILQRDIDPDKLPEQAMWNVLSVFGVNQYVADRYLSEGNIKGAIGSTILPPTPALDMIYKGAKEIKKYHEDDDYNWFKVSKELPIVGPIIYSWYGGGKENYNDRLAAED